MNRRARTLLKRALAPVLWRPLLMILRATGRQAGIVLMYHLVADRDGDPERELVPGVARERFREQLSHLQRYYRFVELKELQTAASLRLRGQPFPVAVTFDDDLGNHVTHALPELQDAKAPATFFLCGSFCAGAPRDFWWQRLQRAVDGGVDVSRVLGMGPDPGSIHQLGQAIEVLSPGTRDAVAEELGVLSGPVKTGDLLTADAAKKLPHIGFHTIRHDRLTELGDEELARALDEGRDELGEVAGYEVDTIAYPHGRADRRVIEAAREKGFSIGVTCKKEPVVPTSDPLALGRYEPPTRASVNEFAFDLVHVLLKSLWR